MISAMDTGMNPHPHAPEAVLGGPRPEPGSIREPSRALKIVAALIGVVILALLGYWVLWRSASEPPPPVTASVDAIDPKPDGGVYAHLTLSNSSDTSQWVSGCTVPVITLTGEKVMGEVRGVTLVPPHGTEPLQGTILKDGAPVAVDPHLVTLVTAPVPCSSSANKQDLSPAP
jgi:hypothetical protein